MRNPRNEHGPPLTAAEKIIHPHADLQILVVAVVTQAKDDLDAGYMSPDGGTANEQYYRAQAYLWFFHGRPTGFERFMSRLGISVNGLLPEHPLFDDAAVLLERRDDLDLLGLPADLFDWRIDELQEMNQ